MISCRGVYLARNTSQTANVQNVRISGRFVRCSGLQILSKIPCRGFSTVSARLFSRRGYWDYQFFRAFFASFVLTKRSSSGIRIRQMTAAVKPPLYRQKPPCILGTEVTSR